MKATTVLAKKILIAEDNLLLSEVHTCLLEKMGYIVLDQQSSAEETIEAAKELEPDVVLMDIKLSGNMNGIKAAEKIDVSVIYLSGSVSKQVKEKALATDCCDYLVKPVQGKDLENAIQKALV